jgi:predicted enzyme related to lactoylglutathione lyase
MSNAINWFEIPAVDLERAVRFYSTILGREVRKADFMGEQQALFSYDDGAVGGAIIARPGFEPSPHGALVYLDTGRSLSDVVARVEPAGGQVVVPETPIGDPGTIAVIIDSEGNRVGLHQEP